MLSALAPGPYAFAQSGKSLPSDDPVAMRRAQLADASAKISAGDELREAGDDEGARKQYQEAFEILPDNALSARQLKLHALDQYSAATLSLANTRMVARQFEEAEALVDDVLGVDPGNRQAAELKMKLQNADPTNPAVTAELLTDIQKVQGLLRNGNDLINLGEYDAARESFNQVLAIDEYNTAARQGLERVDRIVMNAMRTSRDHLRASMIRQVDEQWQVEPPEDLTSAFGGETTDIGGGVGQQSLVILQKLSAIVFPRVEFVDSPLPEVIEFLTLRTRGLDPEGTGVNFVLNGEADRNVSIVLRNVRLVDLLDTIADQTGTSYSVEEFVVEFRTSGSGSASIVSRTFKVPPDFLKTAASTTTEVVDDPFAEESGPETGLATRMNARDFLTQNGVTFPDGSSVYFNPGNSTLSVRNTISNIGLIEEIVNRAMSASPRQVVISLKMLETTVKALNELGMDSLLGSFNVGSSERVFGGGGTVGNQFAADQGLGVDFPFVFPNGGAGSSVPVGSNPLTAGNRTSQVLRDQITIDGLLESASATTNQKSPSVIGVSGVFTDPQFQVVLRALSQKKGVDLATSPKVVVRSGERASVMMVREFIYPTEFDPPEIPQEFGLIGDDDDPFQIAGDAGPTFPVTPTTPTAFETRNVGTTFEVEPVISQDGTSVELNMAPSVVEFEGFINYGSPITSAIGDTQIVLTENKILQPIFRVTQLNTTISVWNNNTVVIGGLVSDELDTIDDQTPIFGDLPFLGMMFRSKVKEHGRRALIFFVTVNVIDPGGQPITGSSGMLSGAN